MRRYVPSALHGRRHTRGRLGCGCFLCVDADRAYRKQLRDARVARFRAGEIQVEHGKRSTHLHYGCGCEACVTANREYLTARRRAAAA